MGNWKGILGVARRSGIVFVQVGAIAIGWMLAVDGSRSFLPGLILFTACTLLFTRKRQWLSTRATAIFLACWYFFLVFVCAMRAWLAYDPEPGKYWKDVLGQAPDILHRSSAMAVLLLVFTAWSATWRKPYRFIAFAPLLLPAALIAIGLSELNLVHTSELPDREPLNVEADKPDDKHPEFAEKPEFWSELVKIQVGDRTLRVDMNLTPAAVAMIMRRYDFLDEKTDDVALFRSYNDALSYGKAQEPETLASVQMVEYKVKSLSDDIMARLEQYLQNESPALGGGRYAALRRLLDLLISADDGSEASAYAIAYMAAGLSLFDASLPSCPAGVEALKCELLDRFNSRPFISRAGGFYTESETLSRIFEQDRFFQQALGLDSGAVMCRALSRAPELAAQYDRILALNSVLTNPPARFSIDDLAAFPSLLDDPQGLWKALVTSEKGQLLAQRYPHSFSPGEETVQLLPFATSRESELFSRLYSMLPGLPQENVMNRFLQALREKQVSLTPSEDSGWYDYKCYALETLLLPETAQEAPKLYMSQGYKEHLLEAFRTLLTQTRETHLKLLPPVQTLGDVISGNMKEPPKIEIPINWSLEPLAACYFRTAQAFEYLSRSLEEILGAQEFNSIPLNNHETVKSALNGTERLLDGLYLRVCKDIGMQPTPELALTEGECTAALAQADAWLKDIATDPCYARDVRVIVPVLASEPTKQARYWMIAGIYLVKLHTRYLREPGLRVVDPASNTVVKQWNGEAKWQEATEWFSRSGFRLVTVGKEFHLPCEVFAESDGPLAPPTREEFRALCDKHKSVKEIAAALQVMGSRQRFLGPAIGAAVFAAMAIAAVLWRSVRARRADPSDKR